MTKLLGAAIAVGLGVATIAVEARAEEFQVGGKPMVVDLTNTAVFNYHFDNRNTVVGRPETIVDDYYGEWLDRMNLQLTWWKLRAGLRLDSATYWHTFTRAKVQEVVGQEFPNDPGQYLRDNDFFNELANRYRGAIYPSKLYVGFAQRGVDVTVGDFYAQLGRGLVFSVRKIDEIAIDTTVRGIKGVFDRDLGPVHLAATAFAGQMNPLRIDETSGRRLNGQGSPLFFGFPSADPIRTYTIGGNNTVVETTAPAHPSYLEDTVLGGRLEGGTSDVSIAANGAFLLRRAHTKNFDDCTASGMQGCATEDFPNAGPSQAHRKIANFGGSINVPDIAKHGDLYVEVAGQSMKDGRDGIADTSGYAVYASGGVHIEKLNVALEGKHYRNFFPLAANVDSLSKGFGAPEFNVLTYSQSPIVEPTYTEPVSGGAPNICITGGWGNVDYRFNDSTKVFGWLGRYASWSDINPVNCDIADAQKTNTWDAASGVEVYLDDHKSHMKAWVGVRATDCVDDNCNNPANAKGSVYYREGYLRYDLVKHIAGPVAIQFQGLHRHRYEPYTFGQVWNEGENYTAIHWAPHFAFIGGIEYNAGPTCITAPDKVCFYGSGGLQWRSGKSQRFVDKLIDTVNVFVGQRRGGFRCVSGVCRPFPPFEGAKVELVSRF